MAVVYVEMPQMGESVMEGTILRWLKAEGDTVEEEEGLLEVATDKVDTEIPSPFKGKLVKLLAQEGDVVEVGKPIASMETDQITEDTTPAKTKPKEPEPESKPESKPSESKPSENKTVAHNNNQTAIPVKDKNQKDRFYSPLVMNIARKESISLAELETIDGSGQGGRVTKKDLMDYLQVRKDKDITHQAAEKTTPAQSPQKSQQVEKQETIQHESNEEPVTPPLQPRTSSISGNYEIEEMSRMRKIISDRMLESKRISAHVTSFVEADVTNIVYWRHQWKNYFKEKENTILTYTPIFIEAVVKAIKDYPRINVSVEGDKIIHKKDINIGLAVSLKDGNLIVPVIKNADQLNIVGLTKKVNELAKKARANKLTTSDVQDGTFTVSNVGSFGNLMGTPILVQPQVGILALGAVVKKPAVIESPQGDAIGIRHLMFLSHTYDHRVVDGSLGGMFVRRVADYLEKFDEDRNI